MFSRSHPDDVPGFREFGLVELDGLPGDDRGWSFFQPSRTETPIGVIMSPEPPANFNIERDIPRSTKDGRRFMRPRSLWIPGFALWMVLMLPWAADAQETNLSGTVTDATDAVLPGVSVTAVKLGHR
jgi:hypothetical protein